MTRDEFNKLMDERDGRFMDKLKGVLPAPPAKDEEKPVTRAELPAMVAEVFKKLLEGDEEKRKKEQDERPRGFFERLFD